MISVLLFSPACLRAPSPQPHHTQPLDNSQLDRHTWRPVRLALTPALCLPITSQVLLPLDNFISKSTDVFLGSQQPNYLALTNQVRLVGFKSACACTAAPRLGQLSMALAWPMQQAAWVALAPLLLPPSCTHHPVYRATKPPQTLELVLSGDGYPEDQVGLGLGCWRPCWLYCLLV